MKTRTAVFIFFAVCFIGIVPRIPSSIEKYMDSKDRAAKAALAATGEKFPQIQVGDIEPTAYKYAKSEVATVVVNNLLIPIPQTNGTLPFVAVEIHNRGVAVTCPAWIQNGQPTDFKVGERVRVVTVHVKVGDEDGRDQHFVSHMD